MSDPTVRLMWAGIVLNGLIFLIMVLATPFIIAMVFGWRP